MRTQTLISSDARYHSL